MRRPKPHHFVAVDLAPPHRRRLWRHVLLLVAAGLVSAGGVGIAVTQLLLR